MFLSEIFLSEQQDAVAIIFGRFNPPHKGHRAAWETAAQYPRWYVGTNQSTQGPKDPLPYDIKIEAMKTIWPEVEDHIVAEQSWLTLASKVFDEHGEVTLVCCTDEEWVTKTIIQYNGHQGAHGYYNFPEIRQEPTPRLSSATALRDAVKAGDREAFSDAAGVSADTPVAGKPFFDLVAEYLLPYQNAPKKVAKKRDLSEGIPLKFNTVELSESQIHNYVKEWYSLYHIDRPHSKSVANIRRLVGKKLAESKEAEAIATFIDMIKSVDYPKTIKIGDHFAVLSFEIVFAWKEINATGFVTPKEVVDIKLNNNGTINYIKFADGDRYPRLTPATYQGKPIEQTAYFTDESSAETTLTALTLKVPSDWELDVSGVRRGIAESSAPHAGDEVYYGTRLVGWFKGYSNHGKIITEPNLDELGDEYANSHVYWDPQNDITIKPKHVVSEGWKSKAGAAALAAATVAGIGMSPKLTVDGVTYDKAISAPPEDAKTVTKDGKRYKVWQSRPLKQRPGGGKYNLYKQIDESAWPFDHLINEEAAGVGVIANKKQAKDPRYSMSLTKDVRPGEVERSLKKLHLK